MARFRLLTPDAQYADDGVIERETAGADVDWDIRRAHSLSELSDESLGACDALVTWHEMKIDAAFVSALRRCRIIVRAGVGFDHIDLATAAAVGIPVCNTPDYGTSEVADHAIGLMLALRRGIVAYHQNLIADPMGGFDHARAPLVRRLRGRVFGVIGLGRIGVATALRAKAFGMTVVAYDPYVSRGSEIAVGVDRVESLKGLLAASDVVSLHCPLTDETREMINAATIAQMKRDAILINTARGAIVDIRALLDALRNGEIAGAGIDVLPIEPLKRDDVVAVAYRHRSRPDRWRTPDRDAPRRLVQSRKRQRRSPTRGRNGDALSARRQATQSRQRSVRSPPPDVAGRLHRMSISHPDRPRSRPRRGKGRDERLPCPNPIFLPPEKELGDAVDLIAWPAWFFANCAAMRSTLPPSGLTQIGRIIPSGIDERLRSLQEAFRAPRLRLVSWPAHEGAAFMAERSARSGGIRAAYGNNRPSQTCRRRNS